MMPTSYTSVFLLAAAAFLVILLTTNPSDACNEAVCASVVSKCMLTTSCKCDMETCNCCKECFSCLGFLYDECCSCVDLCPKPNVTDNPLSKTSNVEDFCEPVPALFQALTADPDAHGRWHTVTYPVDYDVSHVTPKQEKETKYRLQTVEGDGQHPLKPNVLTKNCTVAYNAQCISWNKCKQSCLSMGANSYRWFHDGCCECVGENCINYGINESRCLHCPADKEEDLKEAYDDYGQLDDDDLMDDEAD